MHNERYLSTPRTGSEAPPPLAPPPTHPRVYQRTAHALSLHREHAPGYRPQIPWKFRNRPRIARLTAFLLVLELLLFSGIRLRYVLNNYRYRYTD